MSSTKLENDKYYTPIDLAKYFYENIDGLTLKNNIEEVGLW